MSWGSHLATAAMPPPSTVSHLPASHPAAKQRPRSPNRVLAEAEAQWLFTEAELANTPSIQDGMSQEDEKLTRARGVHFIVQVGILLKLPQLTLSTASIFFQRFLMRASLKKERGGIPKLHHFQSAGIALFLATKVEESCRKLKDMILALCRIAQKNPNLMIDEQSKDWWRWRDCILLNEDVMLETLCFDLTVESPHRQLFNILKYNGLEHNKRLRNAAWGFVTDSNNTQLCLLYSSRTIAVGSIYAACKYCDVQLPDDAKGRPWWEAQYVKLKDIRKALEYMLANYDPAANKINGIAASGSQDDNGSIYAGLSTPHDETVDDEGNSTRARPDRQGSATPLRPQGSERRSSNASSVGAKRSRGDAAAPTSGGNGTLNGEVDHETQSKRPRLENFAIPTPELQNGGAGDIKREEEADTVTRGNRLEEERVTTAPPQAVPLRQAGTDEGEVSEEGEVEE